VESTFERAHRSPAGSPRHSGAICARREGPLPIAIRVHNDCGRKNRYAKLAVKNVPRVIGDCPLFFPPPPAQKDRRQSEGPRTSRCPRNQSLMRGRKTCIADDKPASHASY